MAPFGEREMTPEEPQGSGTKGPPEQAGSQQGTACSGNRTGINRVRLWTARTMSDQLGPGAGVCLISRNVSRGEKPARRPHAPCPRERKPLPRSRDEGSREGGAFSPPHRRSYSGRNNGRPARRRWLWEKKPWSSRMCAGTPEVS